MRKIKELQIITFIIMLFNAFFSLPLIIITTLRKKNSVFLIALFFSILGFYFVSSTGAYDIDRYFEAIENPNTYGKVFFNSSKGIIIFLMKLIIFLKLPSNCLSMFVGFIVYYLIFKTYIKVFDYHNISNRKFLFFFFITYISLPITYYLGVRTALGITIFTYSIFHENKYIRTFGIVFSVFFHTMMLLPMIIYFICYFYLKNKIKFSKLIFIISLVLGIILSPNLILEIIKKINAFGYIYIDQGYIIGNWGKNRLDTVDSLAYKVIQTLFYYMRMMIFILYNFSFYCKVTSYKYKKKKDFILENILFFLMCFCCLISNYYTLVTRYSVLTLYLLYFVLLKKNYYFNSNKIIKKLFYLVIMYFMIRYIDDLKSHRISFFLSYFNIFKISLFNMVWDIISNYF